MQIAVQTPRSPTRAQRRVHGYGLAGRRRALLGATVWGLFALANRTRHREHTRFDAGDVNEVSD
jgi:hypothetical protein